jgi:hypothetical protein
LKWKYSISNASLIERKKNQKPLGRQNHLRNRIGATIVLHFGISVWPGAAKSNAEIGASLTTAYWP